MVSFYFHPDYSGSAIQALALSRRLAALGALPMIVSANLSGAPAEEVIDGIRVVRLPVSRSREWQIPSFWLALAWFLIRHRHEIDVIHAHGTLQHGSASLAGRAIGRPTILKVAMANSDIAFHRQGRLWGAINRFMVSHFDRYIATTAPIEQEFRDQRLDAGRVLLMPNGVDTDLYAPLADSGRRRMRDALGLPDGPIVSYVGIINARKNVDGILRIWARCVERGCAGHLALIGPVPADAAARDFRGQLDAFVADRGLTERVTFAGQQTQVAPWLRASDVFLFPSRQEGMPNSVLEAMSCGVPCVLSTSSGMQDLIADGENGRIRDLGDEEALADAVLALLADPDERARCGARARETIERRFSLDALALQYFRLYGELKAGRR
jgi:glycosyltransferase involved in cell wall biosynthesis